jgi:hypothetical protein
MLDGDGTNVDRRITKLEKDIETSVKLLSLLKDQFVNAKTPSLLLW